MSNDNITSDEFDYIMELIFAVLFMSIGIVGIVFMVNQFNRQTQLQPRVDKVRVSSIDQEQSDPFDFTAYQAYMFSWMMDGHDKTNLFYFAGEDVSIKENDTSYTASGVFPGGYDSGYIGLMPADLANGFIVIRNRAIIGDGEYENYSVKQVIYTANGKEESKVKEDYTGGNGDRWHLDLTDAHTEFKTVEYLDESETTIFEERVDYLWSLHPCSPE